MTFTDSALIKLVLVYTMYFALHATLVTIVLDFDLFWMQFSVLGEFFLEVLDNFFLWSFGF